MMGLKGLMGLMGLMGNVILNFQFSIFNFQLSCIFHAAADGQDDAGDIGAHVAGQEDAGLCHLVHGAGAFHRYAAAPGVHELLGYVGRHLCLHESRGHHVDAYVACGELLGAALAEAYDGGFGGCVVGLVVVARDAHHRADVDYGAVSLAPHGGLYGLGHAEDAFEVGVHHAVELLLCHAFDGAVVGDACVVDEDVDLAEVGEDLLDEGLGGVVVGHVGGVAFGFHAEGGELLLHGDHLLVACASAESHVAALFGEPHGYGVADAACGTGDYGGLVLKYHL